jgi:signal transduction histidine kinase
MALYAKENSEAAMSLTVLGRFFSTGMVVAVWFPIVAITAFHYGTSHEHHWVHDILRRAYYLPIVIAAVRIGLWGGLASAIAVTAAYIPHAFIMPHHFDPARGLEKALEIVLYFIVAVVAGYLADQERKRRHELQLSLNEQKNLTNQLVRAGRLSALGEVVAGIAHEIKNPLHSLAGTAEIVDHLIKKDTDERRMWEIHCDEIGRLNRVSEQFLSFARPTPIELILLDLRNVALRIVRLVGGQARQNNIEITYENQTSRPVMVNGDLDQLAQVGLNIAINAIKALGNKGGKILIQVDSRARQGTKMAYLRIENNGPSIDEDDFEHLFDPFYSGDDGTGLGLSISSRIAEQHDGYIDVENAGLGVRFTLYLTEASNSSSK